MRIPRHLMMVTALELVMAAVLLSCSGTMSNNPNMPLSISARFHAFLDSVRAAPAGERQALVDPFMNAVSGASFPLVDDTQVHFVYKGSTSSGVSIPGDFNQWNESVDRMTNIGNTDFYYLTKTFEADARLDYKFVINDSQWILDPLNTSRVTGGFGENSELAMQGYVQPQEIALAPNIRHGTIESFPFHSYILNNDRRVQIYLPPGYAADKPKRYPSIYVNDGGEYLSLAKMNSVLDFLIDQGAIEELIAVFVDPVDRNKEYSLNSSYVDMLTREMVPYVDRFFGTLRDPAKRGIMGASLGGLVSIFAAYSSPDIFGLCSG